MSFVDSKSPALYTPYHSAIAMMIGVQGVILSPLQDTLLYKYFVVLGNSEKYLVRKMATLHPAWFQFEKDVPTIS